MIEKAETTTVIFQPGTTTEIEVRIGGELFQDWRISGTTLNLWRTCLSCGSKTQPCCGH